MLKTDEILDWLLQYDEPWVKYNTMVHLLDEDIKSPEVEVQRKKLLDHPLIKTMLEVCLELPWPPLKSHKEAKHPLYKFILLSEIGIKASDGVLDPVVNTLLDHQDDTGAFQTILLIPKVFGGDDKASWSWMLCDAPLVLYAFCQLGLGNHPRMLQAAEHLAGTSKEKGWPCESSLHEFHGPGRREDPCPCANLASLKALSCFSQFNDSPACRKGTEMLLNHWQERKERKIRMFGIGTDFLRLKYPFIWYDLLHMVEILSRFNWTHNDPSYLEMFDMLMAKADSSGRYTPESAWMAYKGFDFAQKREPSPYLTFLVERIKKRMGV